MALTITQIFPGGGTTSQNFPAKYTSDRKRPRFNIAADAAYPTGGYPITPSQVGLAEQIDFVDITNQFNPGATGNTAFWWNKATNKMQAIVVSTGAEVNNGTDIHLCNADIIVEGF